MTNALARRPWLLLAIASAVVLVFMASRDAGAQSEFFDPCGGYEFASTTPGEAGDINSTFGIGIGPDCLIRTADDDRARYNFGGVVTFTPEAWGVAAGDDLPVGTKIGELSSDAVLGLFNNPCRTELRVDFDLVNASIDTTDTIDPLPSGEADRLQVLAEDTDSDGTPDGAEQWPSYLNELFDHVPNLQDTIYARLYGQNTLAVPGTSVILNFLIFKPGTQVSELIAIDERLGYESVTVLNDPTATASSQDPVNDFCSPLATRTTLLGEADGNDFRWAAEQDGTYPFVTFTASQRDNDGDGIENSLDPCWDDPDPDWNPRGELIQNPGDMDGDLLPDSCDPFPNTPSECAADSGFSNTDEDCDGWMNSADNCPLVPNGPDEPPDQEDTDSDGIGDACDPDPEDEDAQGEPILVCRVTNAVVGAGGTPAYDPQTLAPCDPTATPQTGPTPGPGNGTATPGPGNGDDDNGGQTGGGGVNGGPDSGVGVLSPTSSGVPLWALALLAVAGVGLISGIALTTKTVRERRKE